MKGLLVDGVERPRLTVSSCLVGTLLLRLVRAPVDHDFCGVAVLSTVHAVQRVFSSRNKESECARVGRLFLAPAFLVDHARATDLVALSTHALEWWSFSGSAAKDQGSRPWCDTSMWRAP